MVQLAQAAPAAAATASKKSSKKSKSRLDRLNVRAIYARGLVAKLVAELVGQVDRLEDGKTKTLVAGALEEVDGASKKLDGASKIFFRLKEVKWEPAGGAVSFRAGDVVSIKARRTERFTKHGAYFPADLRNCKVVSVHGGRDAKLVTAKGESLGLVPLHWLAAGDAK